ncbi:MAG TPA: hypothetical protein VGI95_04375 [Caulobacteraceae bacterium]
MSGVWASAPRITRSGPDFRAEPWAGTEPTGGWREAFEVFAGDNPTSPGLLGSYRREGEAIVFTPRFTPAPSVRLRAVLRPPSGEPAIAWFGGVPRPERAPSARVLSVTPSADVWPENILRFYVTFSAPMRIGVAWDHIRMLDAAGRPMGGMFVEIDQELWDPEGRRLTVLFDPGRIKRGLVDNINEGPPFQVGERCTLQIEHFWRDSANDLLAQPFEKTVTISAPLREGLDPADWRLTPPTASNSPLTVDFPRPLDAALAVRALSVELAGRDVAGTAQLEASETRFVFRPDAPWTPGDYRLIADPVLEDIAGNRIGRPFDIDRRAPGGAEAAARGAEVGFSVPYPLAGEGVGEADG